MARIDQVASYTIVLQGYADATLVDWCGPVTMVTTEAEGAPAVTTLAELRTDQAGIFGVARYLHGLGMVLLSIVRNETEER